MRIYFFTNNIKISSFGKDDNKLYRKTARGYELGRT
jgi:hypothetical protein